MVVLISCITCNGQAGTDRQQTTTSHGPNSITRTIKQDRKGNIWLATFEGVFRYDGKYFANVTSQVTSARFFSILEDRKGNLWFGSIGSGVYQFDGKSFQSFTTKNGLINNEITAIYQDKAGNIWFGANGGASRYDGKSFRNYMMGGDSVKDIRGKSLPDAPPINEVTSIIEDRSGKFWFGTRGNVFVYDGKSFAVFKNSDGKPFMNVRSLIKDKSGNIWLGGNDGLWRYDGSTFTNLSRTFVGYIYEDRKGNIWTSSGSEKRWALSRYDQKSLTDKNAVPETIKGNEGMIFGILEDKDGNIWFGTLDGAYRYDGTKITDFSILK